MGAIKTITLAWVVVITGTWSYGCKQEKVHRSAYSIQVSDSTLVVEYEEREVLAYRLTPQSPPAGADSVYTRSGFIHPLRSPSGVVLTDGFPVGHMHQHGLFFAFTNTTFKGKHTDFWNQQNKEGYVRHGKLLETQVNDSVASFKVILEHISVASGKVGEEEWAVKVRAKGSVYIIDLTSTWTNVSADTLHINEYLYGGFAFRGSASWNSEDSLHFEDSLHILTSEGLHREQANHTHPTWVSAYGPVLGKTAGVVISGAASNFRYPQAVRVHPQMPYFVFAPMVDGAFTILAGASYISKYRMVTFDGELNKEVIKKYEL